MVMKQHCLLLMYLPLESDKKVSDLFGKLSEGFRGCLLDDSHLKKKACVALASLDQNAVLILWHVDQGLPPQGL